MHSEDAVAFALLGLVASLAFASPACSPRGPSPSAALEGSASRRDRDAGVVTNDDEEDKREDQAAVLAGISLRALSCDTDHQCLTHRCDVDHKRCRFPCRDDSDCQNGARCEVDAGTLAACFVNRR